MVDHLRVVEEESRPRLHRKLEFMKQIFEEDKLKEIEDEVAALDEKTGGISLRSARQGDRSSHENWIPLNPWMITLSLRGLTPREALSTRRECGPVKKPRSGHCSTPSPCK
jgi:hypothetical protein